MAVNEAEWSLRDRLLLVSAVQRSDNDDWPTVSSTLVRLSDPGDSQRFSHAVCAHQYSQLLASTADCGGSGGASAEALVCRLRDQRIEQLRALMAETRAAYRAVAEDLRRLRLGLLDDQLDEMLAAGVEIDDEDGGAPREHAQLAPAAKRARLELPTADVSSAFAKSAVSVAREPASDSECQQRSPTAATVSDAVKEEKRDGHSPEDGVQLPQGANTDKERALLEPSTCDHQSPPSSLSQCKAATSADGSAGVCASNEAVVSAAVVPPALVVAAASTATESVNTLTSTTDAEPYGPTTVAVDSASLAQSSSKVDSVVSQAEPAADTQHEIVSKVTMTEHGAVPADQAAQPATNECGHLENEQVADTCDASRARRSHCASDSAGRTDANDSVMTVASGDSSNAAAAGGEDRRASHSTGQCNEEASDSAESSRRKPDKTSFVASSCADETRNVSSPAAAAQSVDAVCDSEQTAAETVAVKEERDDGDWRRLTECVWRQLAGHQHAALLQRAESTTAKVVRRPMDLETLKRQHVDATPDAGCLAAAAANFHRDVLLMFANTVMSGGGTGEHRGEVSRAVRLMRQHCAGALQQLAEAVGQHTTTGDSTDRTGDGGAARREDSKRRRSGEDGHQPQQQQRSRKRR